MNRKLIARELLKVAKLLTGFWDLKIEPPSHADITKAKNVVIDCLQKLGAKCDKLAFQRFLVYQENKECTGQNCDRNSNKHLCIFADHGNKLRHTRIHPCTIVSGGERFISRLREQIPIHKSNRP